MTEQPMRTRFSDEGITQVLGDDRLRARFAAIRASFEVPEDFPEAVLAEADAVVTAPLDRPERDESAIPFLTIDPPGSMDLDQALHIERAEGGFRVRYAIAYLPAYVAPGGAIDAETRERGQTIYCPDERTPLHPTQLSEGAASLLPGQVRAAYVWDMHVRDDGEGDAVEVYRALVRSVDRFDYAQVQDLIDGGTEDERLLLLKEVGEGRIAFEQRRGGASLPMPEQEVTQDAEGHFVLGFRPPLLVEEWNAQISLMTGMAAAELMATGGIGILRTLPDPDPGAVSRFRRQAHALGIVWPKDEPYGAFLRRLDRTDPKHLALIYDATSLFRGSAYQAFDGQLPDHPEHGALNAIYAHVTAPLRRLVDRFGLAVAEALSQGGEVPAWAREALPGLPAVMAESGTRASGVERACTDAVEAAVLEPRVGEKFEAVVVDSLAKGRLLLQLTDPAVVASAKGQAEMGAVVTAQLVRAEVETGAVGFELVPASRAANNGPEDSRPGF